MDKSKIYIAADTNMFVCFLETGFLLAQQEGGYTEPEDLEVLQNFLKVLDGGKIELILPEIVTLECERIKNEKPVDLDRIYKSAIKAVEDTNIHNKKIAKSSLDKISGHMNEICMSEKENIKKAWSILQKIFKHKNAHIISLDETILLDAYKRGIMGKRPFAMRFSGGKDPNRPIHDIQPDCIFVESVEKFLIEKKKFELYLCTNDSGFFTTFDKKELAPEVKSAIQVKDFFRSVSEMLDKVLGIKPTKAKKQINENLTAFPLVEKSDTEEGSGSDPTTIVKG